MRACLSVCMCFKIEMPPCLTPRVAEERGCPRCRTRQEAASAGRREGELVVIHYQQLPSAAERSAEFISIVPPVKLFDPPHCPRSLVSVLLLPIQLLPTTCCRVAEPTTITSCRRFARCPSHSLCAFQKKFQSWRCAIV